MNTYVIGKQLIDHEGIRLFPYRCPAGQMTIGVGRNLDTHGITNNEAVMMLQNDIRECADDLREFVFAKQFDQLPEKIQHVLIDMRFQLGPAGFRGFRRMIRAVQDGSWPDMIREMVDSEWYRQTTERACRLIKMVQEVMDGK